MNEVTPEIAEKFVAYLEDFPGNHGKTLTARTWNRHLTSLKLIYRTLSRQSGGKNPFEHIPRRPTVDNCKKEFTATQLDGIFKAIKDKTIILQNRKEIEILFRIGIYSGMRQCDCVLLEWSDIDFIQETIKCKNLKTGNPVIIPMIPEFLAILKKWRQDHRGSRYVLPQTARRFGTSPTALNNDLTRIIDYGISSLAERKGGKRPKRKSAYGFHSLRHTFVSNCAAAGVSLAVVQSIVGHGSPAMTRHYTHIGTNTAREELRRISSGQTSAEKLQKIAEIIDSEKGPAEMVAAIRGVISS
jgi:integrase